jgi:hypothetical protein
MKGGAAQPTTLFIKCWVDPAYLGKGKLTLHSLGIITTHSTTLEKLVGS